MSSSIVAAIIAGIVALAGNVITVIVSSNKTRSEMQIAQAEMRKDITHLTDEVREHNNFARRMPVVEEQIKEIKHRINDLERRE